MCWVLKIHLNQAHTQIIVNHQSVGVETGQSAKLASQFYVTNSNNQAKKLAKNVVFVSFLSQKISPLLYFAIDHINSFKFSLLYICSIKPNTFFIVTNHYLQYKIFPVSIHIFILINAFTLLLNSTDFLFDPSSLK